MPDIATDYQTAASSLLRICHACSLLLQQRRLVKNAPAFVASAAQYALTVTLPMPQLDPAVCFWRKSPMRRETQTNLLFLIRRMCRIYRWVPSFVNSCIFLWTGLIYHKTCYPQRRNIVRATVSWISGYSYDGLCLRCLCSWCHCEGEVYWRS